MASEIAEDHDLDDLLDSALEDFQKVDAGRGVGKDAASSSTGAADRSDNAASSMHGATGDEGRTVGKGLGLGLPERKKGTKKGKAAAAPEVKEGASRGGVRAQPSAAGPNNVAATIEKLAQQTRQAVEGVSPAQLAQSEPINDEEALEQLVQQFEQLGGNQDMHSLMDTVMRQLLSKEVLHAPMQEIGERYPAWLETNKATLSEEDYNRYSRQYDYIKQLCNVYDTTPDDFNLIIELMQQMQNCGQPPKDIVAELAPGMDFSEDGMPMLPELFGAAGENPQQCNVM
eukprot:TRINITY_DN23130_c0_g1_i1.p1 TRINITY_DN23130_c0_g1~~TRINITY_DN23130_c0_g1_i1.p1  ORF type:complete len:286 (+),score=78.99 TRINITY_DN23130_c0_g1_i1:22-879(+)